LETLPAVRSSGSALPALTGARFFAASAVVAFHFGGEAMRDLGAWFERAASVGPAAVSFFYVLSGTVMTWGCTGPDGRSARPARTFWVQRASRIAPAYFAALVVSLPTFAAAVLALHDGAAAVARIGIGLAAGLVLVQAFFPPLAAGLNTPGWSISCEAFFYALWPGLVGRLRRSRPGLPWRAGLVLYAISMAPPLLAIAAMRAGIVPPGPFPTLLDDVSGGRLVARAVSYFPLLRAPEFAMGIVLGHALRATPPRTRSVAVDTVREALLVLALAGLAWILGAGDAHRDDPDAVPRRILIESGTLAPILALLVWQLARGRGWLQRALSVPTLLVLGEASYALYIFQEPVYVWLTAALKRVAPMLFTRWDLTFWGYAAVLVAVSLAVHRFIEQPLRRVMSARLGKLVSRPAVGGLRAS
jgi:peptidoglycan/LPS O-acetylase OafA/YrhL